MDLQKIAEEAFVDELQKIGGTVSEMFGMSSPLGAIGTPIGGLAAAMTPTKTKDQMIDQQSKVWSNFLPGVGAYRFWKRMGYSQKEMNKNLAVKRALELSQAIKESKE